MNSSNFFEHNKFFDKGDLSDQTCLACDEGENSNLRLFCTITKDDLNAAPAVPLITLGVFPGVKPADKTVVGFYLKTNEAFVSPTRDVDEVSPEVYDAFGFLLNVTFDMPVVNQTGTIGNFHFGWGVNRVLDGRVYIDFTGGGNNPQDFTAGSVSIYLELIDFKTI